MFKYMPVDFQLLAKSGCVIKSSLYGVVFPMLMSTHEDLASLFHLYFSPLNTVKPLAASDVNK